jgi:thioredoxin reductase (NADPH)
VHFGESFNHMIKPWILPEFEKLVASGAIRMRWNARVVAIEKARVRVATTRGEEWIPARRVYLMTGYTPEPGLLGELGVPFDATTGVPRHNPATMETSVPNVFVAGVIASGNDANSVFIENGRDHGALIARALSARRGSR